VMMAIIKDETADTVKTMLIGSPERDM